MGERMPGERVSFPWTPFSGCVNPAFCIGRSAMARHRLARGNVGQNLYWCVPSWWARRYQLWTTGRRQGRAVECPEGFQQPQPGPGQSPGALSPGFLQRKPGLAGGASTNVAGRSCVTIPPSRRRRASPLYTRGPFFIAFPRKTCYNILLCYCAGFCPAAKEVKP